MHNLSKCKTNNIYFDEQHMTYKPQDYVKVRSDEHHLIGSNFFPSAKFKYLKQTAADLYQLGQSAIAANTSLIQSGADRNMFLGDCIVAGGIYSEYLDTSPFSLAFPFLYKHIKMHRDINVFINAKLKMSPRHNHATHSIRRGSVNTIHTPFNTSPTSMFDYDCFKIWRGVYVEYLKDASPVTQNISVHKSLFINDGLTSSNEYDYFNNPSFIHLNKFLSIRSTNICICKYFLRILKAAFKGFYNHENLIAELIYARVIFKNDTCSICSDSFFCV